MYRNLVLLRVAKRVVGGCRAKLSLLAVARASLLDDSRAVSSAPPNATAMVVARALVKRAAKAASDSDVGHVTLVILSCCCAEESRYKDEDEGNSQDLHVCLYRVSVAW